MHVTSAQIGVARANQLPQFTLSADFGAEAIPLPDNSVDIVMMFKSLHHVPGALLGDAMREIRAILRN